MAYIEFILMMDRHQQLIKEAERIRLIKKIKMHRKKRSRKKLGLINRVMIHIGETLVRTGFLIKNRFEPSVYSNTENDHQSHIVKCA